MIVCRWCWYDLTSVHTMVVVLENNSIFFYLQVVPSWSWRCLPVTKRLWLTGRVYCWGQRGCLYLQHWQPWCYSRPPYVNSSYAAFFRVCVCFAGSDGVAFGCTIMNIVFWVGGLNTSGILFPGRSLKAEAEYKRTGPGQKQAHECPHAQNGCTWH